MWLLSLSGYEQALISHCGRTNEERTAMANGHRASSACVIRYDAIRNLTSPAEKENGVQTWFANASAREILEIGTEDNLRSYIAEHSASKRNTVHKQIENCIIENPDRFINRNSGITITCTDCVVDDSRRTATLKNASIINGAQTQGELKRYFADLEEDDDADFLIRAEIIMDPSLPSIVEIAIARNTATSVKSVSQAAARGLLTELKQAIESGLPGETLQMSETDSEGLSTQNVLQYARLMMPDSILGDKAPPKNFPYKQGGKCLTDFSNWAGGRGSDPVASRSHSFVIDIAPAAVREYRRWEAHDGWNGHRLHEKGRSAEKPKGGRPVRRDKRSNKVNWVAPGILFPIMSALSAFVIQRNGRWVLEKPHLFKEEELIRRAVQQFRALDREVTIMGRSEAAYDALSIYTETIASVLADR
jgi:AIPR protein